MASWKRIPVPQINACRVSRLGMDVRKRILVIEVVQSIGVYPRHAPETLNKLGVDVRRPFIRPILRPKVLPLAICLVFRPKVPRQPTFWDTPASVGNILRISTMSRHLLQNASPNSSTTARVSIFETAVGNNGTIPITELPLEILNPVRAAEPLIHSAFFRPRLASFVETLVAAETAACAYSASVCL